MAQYPVINDNIQSLLNKICSNTADLDSGGGGGGISTVHGTTNQINVSTVAGVATISLGINSAATTFLGTPTSANLAAAVSDETGTGSLVFATSPTLVTPTLGVATATSINGHAIPAGATSFTVGPASSTVNSITTWGGTAGATLLSTSWLISGNTLTSPFGGTLVDNGSGGLAITSVSGQNLTLSTTGTSALNGIIALQSNYAGSSTPWRLFAPNLPTSSGVSAAIGISNNANQAFALGFNYVGSGSTANSLNVSAVGGLEVMRWTAQGNALIGTTTDFGSGSGQLKVGGNLMQFGGGSIIADVGSGSFSLTPGSGGNFTSSTIISTFGNTANNNTLQVTRTGGSPSTAALFASTSSAALALIGGASQIGYSASSLIFGTQTTTGAVLTTQMTLSASNLAVSLGTTSSVLIGPNGSNASVGVVSLSGSLANANIVGMDCAGTGAALNVKTSGSTAISFQAGGTQFGTWGAAGMTIAAATAGTSSTTGALIVNNQFAVSGSNGNVYSNGTIATGAGATAAAQPWNLGGLRTSTGLLVSTTQGIQISVAGVLYTVALLTTNP